MAAHRIALKGPWEFVWMNIDHSQPLSGKVTMPAAYRKLHGSAAGIVRYIRKFHLPALVVNSGRSDREPHLRDSSFAPEMAIEVEGVRGTGVARMNGEILGVIETHSTSYKFPLGNDQPRFSTLEIELEVSSAQLEMPLDHGLFGVVYLTIDDQTASG
jgi:hypothetical protein